MGRGAARVQERDAHRSEGCRSPLRARAGLPRREGPAARLLGARGDGSPRPEQLRRPAAPRRVPAVHEARRHRACARARRRDPRRRAHTLGGARAARACPRSARPAGRGGHRPRSGGEGGAEGAGAAPPPCEPPAQRGPRGRGRGLVPEAHRDPHDLPELGGPRHLPRGRGARRRGRGSLPQGHRARGARAARHRHVGARELPDRARSGPRTRSACCSRRSRANRRTWT